MTPKLKIETWPTDKVLAYAKNARLHSDAQIAAIAASIKEFGFVNPCLVDADDVLIAGHGRILGAKSIGMETVPVIRLGHLTEQQARALRIADNSLPLLATWDRSLITAEIGTLKLEGYDLQLLGFPEAQLRGWGVAMGTEGAQDPEVAPEPPKKPIVRKGDLWVLGDHRILCGDSTNKKDVAAVMGTDKAVLMNTDPPYGIDYGKILDSIRANGRGRQKYADIENDELDGAALQKFLERVIRVALPHLVDKPAFYLWHPMLTQGTFFAAAAAAAADILIHRQIIWVKPSLIMGRGHYHWRHELCFYGWIRGKRCAWYGAHAQDTVWPVDRENDNIHPTQKPTVLFARPIENNTKRGEVIYEPFSGSGSQIIAAEMTGRKCRALELDPAYCQVGIERWQTFSGKLATLEGKTLEQVAKARRSGLPKGLNAKKAARVAASPENRASEAP